MLTVGFGEGGGEVLTDGEGAGRDVLTLGRGVGFGEGLGVGDGLGVGCGDGAGDGGGGGGASLAVLPGSGARLVRAREVGVEWAVVRRWDGLGRTSWVGASEGD
jgi:protein crumbs